MKIRQANPADANEAAFLIRSAILDIAEVLTGEQEESEILAGLAFYFRAKGNRLSYENALVAEVDGEVAGLVLAYHGKDAEQLDKALIEILREKSGDSEVSLEIEADLIDFYIDTLCINPAYRGKGFGTRLVKAVENLAEEKGFPRISLNVEKANLRAQSLYKQLGYITSNIITINGHSYDYMVKTLA